MAKQASDTAFRTVGISRKASDNNLNMSQKNEVYEQNPKVYLYQQQQQKTISSRPQHRPQPDDDVSSDWLVNNQMLQSEPRQAIEHTESLQSDSTIDRLRRNLSLPDMNSEYVKNIHEQIPVRTASPEELLPGQATNRSRSRPRMQPHHFITSATSGGSVQAAAIDDHEPSQQNERIHLESIEQIARPPTPQRSTSRLARSRTVKSRNPQQICSDVPDHHLSQPEQQRQVLSNESLPEYSETLPLAINKELPVIPIKPAHPSLPTPSDALKKSGSCGLIPQDVLKNMDSKDLKKAIKATVIASRVYRVMTPDQIDILKKEQNELTDFIESMNVSLHIECRMRDASHSLIRLHENNSNLESVKDATSQLQATTRRMDRIFQQIQEAMQRLLTIQRALLQHEGAILNAGLRRLDSENRELSRTVMQLDTARGQEKEEKIKWKKEHNRLKIQSVLFPSTPVQEDFADKAVPSLDLQQIQQAQLASMETYVKELDDDILQKDEKITDLGNQLQAVKDWANDFQSSIQSRKDAHEEIEKSESEEPLQTKLQQLQTDIEHEFKETDFLTQELKSKVESLSEENSTLVSNSKTLLSPEERPYQSRRAYRIKSHSRQGSDLRMVLQESLLELDRQIQLEETSSRPSSTSTSATAFSFDSSYENNDTSLNKSYSDRRTSGRSSRTQSNGSQSGLGLREQVLTRGFHFEDALQESGQSSSDDDTVVGDPNIEIERLNAMVKELEAISNQRSTEIKSH
ncbi:hypothetical protein BGX27_006245 [Mortierella sp. AM989]|nr:hypothetical protein BGX27_006245 [Mortierella sp. AM989]